MSIIYITLPRLYTGTAHEMITPVDLLALVVLAMTSAFCSGGITVHKSTLPGKHDCQVCINDRVELAWVLGDEWSNGELVGIEVQNLQHNENLTVARFDVFQYDPGSCCTTNSYHGEFSSSLEIVDRVPKSLERSHTTIQCLLDGPFKIPSIRAVSQKWHPLREWPFH